MKHFMSYLSIVASLLAASLLYENVEPFQDPDDFHIKMSQLYGEGYDGQDIKAINVAWNAFIETDGLSAEERKIDYYWIKIEVNETYRIIEILPKPGFRSKPEDPEYTELHWTFGTEGRFWIHKATFDIDKMQVLPPSMS